MERVWGGLMRLMKCMQKESKCWTVSFAAAAISPSAILFKKSCFPLCYHHKYHAPPRILYLILSLPNTEIQSTKLVKVRCFFNFGEQHMVRGCFFMGMIANTHSFVANWDMYNSP